MMLELGASLLRAFKRPLVWWIVVAEWEQAVRVRLGRKTARLGPGVHFRIPFLDRIYVQSIRLRTIEATAVTCATSDRRTVVLDIALSFCIEDVLRLYQTLAGPDQTLLTWASEAAVRHIEKRQAADVSAEAVADSIRIDGGTWGLSDVRASVPSLTICRAHRVMLNNYRTDSGLVGLDGAGER